MNHSHIYLLEECSADSAIYEGTAAYRNEKDADRAWRTATLKAIRKGARKQGEEPPKDLEDLDDGDLSATAEYYSEVVYQIEIIDFYE